MVHLPMHDSDHLIQQCEECCFCDSGMAVAVMGAWEMIRNSMFDRIIRCVNDLSN